MKFVIRVDDIGWTDRPLPERPLKEPDRELLIARKFHDAMGGLPYLAGVIPSTLDDAGRYWLSSRPAGMTIAMHGVYHTRVDGVSSEFRGLNFSECGDRLINGVLKLGMATRHFIPPFNAMEPELEVALRDEEFSVVWGQYTELPLCPVKTPFFTFVPSFLPLYGATKWRMKEGDVILLDEIKDFVDKDGAAVITLHLPWELARGGDGFGGVRELVDRVKDLVVSPEQYLEMYA